MGDELQIYKDFGLLGSLTVKLSLNASRLPLFSIGFTKSKGYARTFFNQVNRADESNKADTIARAIAIGYLLRNNSAQEVNMLNKPYKVTHKFDESTCNLSFLWWRKKCLNAKDKIKVTYPEGYKRDYYRYVEGKRTGVNKRRLSMM